MNDLTRNNVLFEKCYNFFVKQQTFFKKGKNSNGIWDDEALIKMYDKTTAIVQEQIQQSKIRKSSSKPSSSNSKDQSSNKEQAWKVNDSCMAIFADDGKCYPAKILSIQDKNIEVVYTDYDETAIVQMDQLFRNKSMSSLNLYYNDIHERLAQLEKIENSCDNANVVDFENFDLRDDEVEWTDGDNEMSNDVPTQKTSNTINASGGKNETFPIPDLCPPPPPSLFGKIAQAGNNKEALTNMLMSWYMSGYHTGFYQGLQQGKTFSEKTSTLIDHRN